MRRDAKSAKYYLIARRSFRIWPVEGLWAENEDAVIKKFFDDKIGVPESVLNNIMLDTIRPTLPGAKSKIQNEYVVTFAEVEA